MKSVLTVDDSDFIRKIVKGTLEKSGYAVKEASTGESALKILNNNNHFDLIITDIHMPGINGLELAKNIRKNPELNQMHIIMLTTESGQNHLEQAIDIGIVHWLVKPFQPGELLSRVNALCS